jgi:hypothetical protein
MKEEGSSKLTCSLGLFGDEGRRDFFHVMHTPKAVCHSFVGQ